MDWEFDILYAIQSIRTPFLDKVMAFLSTIGNAGALWIVIGVVLCIFKKIPPWRYADAFRQSFLSFYSGQSDNKKYGRQIETMSDR